MGGHDLELWLVRHGQSEASVARRIAGWLDTPLTDRGRDEARSLAGVLAGERFTGVWSSDLSRAMETASLAWGEATPDRRLREVNFGEWEGERYARMDQAADRLTLAFRGLEAPGGEHVDQTLARVADFVEGLAPGRHLLFVHGGVIRLLTQDLGLDAFVPTCSVVALAWSPRSLLFLRMPPGAIPFGGAPELDLSTIPLAPW